LLIVLPCLVVESVSCCFPHIAIMKQGANPVGTLAAHLVESRRNIHSARADASSAVVGCEALATLVSTTTRASTGAAMPDQFTEHVSGALTGQEMRAGAEIESFSGIVEKIGRDSVQAILLSLRVRFTGLVERALFGGTLAALEEAIRQERSEVIARLFHGTGDASAEALAALQTVLQEQMHTTRELAAAQNTAARWSGEMRFYDVGDGDFLCRCSGRSWRINAGSLDASSKAVLVTTEVTKEIRRFFFEAMCGGPGTLIAAGAAGTGKTETVKDIADMLGLRHVVISANSELPDSDEFWRSSAQQAGVIIVDEANRAPRASIEVAARVAAEAGVPLCLTYNPGYAYPVCNPEDVLQGHFVYAETRLPQRNLILSSMFAQKGLQTADDLADRLDGLFASMQTGCTKQPYYDFGLRKLKQVTEQSGVLWRNMQVFDEAQAVTTAVQLTVGPGMEPSDEGVLMGGLVEHFGMSSVTPLSSDRDFWSVAASRISRTMASRHCGVCLPVMPSEENFVLAVAEEEAAKAGAKVLTMQGNMADLSVAQLYGELRDGQWHEGEFSEALRRAVSTEGPAWLVVFCGDLAPSVSGPEKWEQLNTLMDDNRVLRLSSGETIRLRPSDRVLFAAQDMEHASPATVSRLGIVNLSAQHRQRM